MSKTLIFVVLVICLAVANAYGGGRRAAPVFRAAPAPIFRAPTPVFRAPVAPVIRGGRWGGVVAPAPVFVGTTPCDMESIRSCGAALTTSASACRAVCKANCLAKERSHPVPVAVHPAPVASGPAPPAITNADLGLMADLPGRWVGEGFNMVQLPNFDSATPSNYRVLVSRTKEIFDFTSIGGTIANRGCSAGINNHGNGQRDIVYHGLTYMQSVTDFYTGEGLHIEPGLFLNVPATDFNPSHNATVVRMASIPHGDTIHCESQTLLTTDLPAFDPIDTTPTGPIANFLIPVTQEQCPPTITPEIVRNPSIYLQNQIAGQKIIKTNVIEVNSKIEGSTSNIPYIRRNADATEVDSIFWIETVQNPDGSTFLQLQYTQTVFLKFLGSVFPHTTVATLRKQ